MNPKRPNPFKSSLFEETEPARAGLTLAALSPLYGNPPTTRVQATLLFDAHSSSLLRRPELVAVRAGPVPRWSVAPVFFPPRLRRPWGEGQSTKLRFEDLPMVTAKSIRTSDQQW